jgi:hypothetical protein
MKVMKFETNFEDDTYSFWDEVYDMMDKEAAVWITGENRQNPTEPDEWGIEYAVIPREGWPTGCGVVVVETDGIIHRYVVDDIYDVVDEGGEGGEGSLLINVFGLDTHINPKLVWYQEI